MRPQAQVELPARGASEDSLARELRGFGLLGILSMLAILFGNGLFAPLSALLVLLWAWWSHTPWREIGLIRPKSWVLTIAGGIALGSTLKILMKMLVMPLLGAPPVNHAFHYLTGNQAALPAALYALIIGAGFGEEIVFRGYMFERLKKIFGAGAGAKTLIVVITAAWFGLGHYSLQGVPGVQQATIFGLIFGAIFAVTGRLWLLIVAHAAFNVTALALIYWNLEINVATFIFDK